MADMVLRLNLDDLRALFGGDDKPSVDFRTAIANKFASDHLKAMISSQVITERDALVKTEIQRTMKETVLEDGNWVNGTKTQFQAHYRNMIDITIDKEITDLIKRRVDEANDKITTSTLDAKKEVERIRDSMIITYVNNALHENKIQALVNTLIAHHIEEFSKQMLTATLAAASIPGKSGV